MSDLTDLEKRIQERLGITEERRQLRQNHLQRQMQEFEQRHQHFTALADGLMAQVIRPRMRKVAEHFDNAKFPEADQPRSHHCVCCLERTERFPATVRLELAVSHDGDYETAQVLYHLEILPVFFAFKGKDQLAITRNTVNEAQVAAWVDDRLVDFLDTYLRLETMEPYQNDNLAIDLVCGMRVNKALAPARMEYQDRTYYFCVDECRQKFAANPGRYLNPGTAHA
jgi:YHS domain-containing protein